MKKYKIHDLKKAQRTFNKFTIDDVLARGYNLEPLTCVFCDSEEVVFNQYIRDAHCSMCGK